MSTGTYISGGAHGLLILWLLFGGFLLRNDPPLPPDSADVSLISAEDFAALSQPQQNPSAAVDIPTPALPEIDASPVPVPRPQAAPAPAETPEAQAPSEPDPVPEAPDLIQPPDTGVTDNVATLVQPPTPDIAVPDLTTPSDTPQPQEAPRVAPIPVPETPLSPEIADTATPRVSPDADTDQRAEDEPAATPEAATTEIVTEAETPTSSAPADSRRPVARPPRRTAAAAPPQTDAIADAVATAVADTPTPAAPETPAPQPAAQPSGPPLSRGEKDALRVAVQQCWNVGSLSSEALNVTVVVAVSMTREARPASGSIRMLSSSGGSGEAARQAYEAARRAIIRCGARGYDLPADKYSQWRDIEITFNPERMRIK